MSSRPARSALEGSALPIVSHRKPLPYGPANALTQLRRFTPARIALGRTGNSALTENLLDFSLAHALARDAVHAALDVKAITGQLSAAQLESIQVRSAATNRATYLRRPDLGRKLDEASRNLLASLNLISKPEVVFIIADGLSAIAPELYAVPLIVAVVKLLPDWQIGPVIIADQARVALSDEVGELLQAEIVVMLIGERPGLSSPDSLGIYLTYNPKVGRTDAERNCISNVREEGLSIDQAAQTLHYLLVTSRNSKLSGFSLKDERTETHLQAPAQKQLKST